MGIAPMMKAIEVAIIVGAGMALVGAAAVIVAIAGLFGPWVALLIAGALLVVFGLAIASHEGW